MKLGTLVFRDCLSRNYVARCIQRYLLFPLHPISTLPLTGDRLYSLLVIYFFKDFIYLFDRYRSQVGREAGGAGWGWEEGSLLSRETDVGLDPRTLESWPEPKAEVLTH